MSKRANTWWLVGLTTITVSLAIVAPTEITADAAGTYCSGVSVEVAMIDAPECLQP